jgi:hypothetical protein
LIERCWSEKAEVRPSFSEIWEELAKSKFEVVEGVDPVQVMAFPQMVEEWRKTSGK